MSFLRLEAVSGGYDRIRVLHEVSLSAEAGAITAIFGPNGAGKTTTLRAIMGAATVSSGRVWIDDVDVTGWQPSRVIRECSAMIVPEGRQLFPDLTVKDNLMMGGYAAGLTARTERARIDELADAFPVIRSKLHHRANALSGGEQQIVAIARAMVSRPRLLLADEVSQGISPVLTLELWRVLRRLADDGASVLMVEQNVAAALRVADRGIILRDGRVVHQGSARDLETDTNLAAAYLS